MTLARRRSEDSDRLMAAHQLAQPLSIERVREHKAIGAKARDEAAERLAEGESPLSELSEESARAGSLEESETSVVTRLVRGIGPVPPCLFISQRRI